MTDRRSMQTNAARQSRAFQFIPGHVGGRVASAQPVRRRASVGAVENAPGTPPTGAYIYEAAGVGCGTAPADVSSAISLCVAQGNNVAFTAPTGWSTILSGSCGGNYLWAETLKWAVARADSPPAAGATPTWSVSGGGATFASKITNALYFTGGSAGSLTVEMGPATEDRFAYFNDTPSGALWAYVGALKGTYYMSPGAVGAAAGHVYVRQDSVDSAYIAPGSGTHSGGSFTTNFTLDFTDAYIEWETIGVYGAGASSSMAFVWRP